MMTKVTFDRALLKRQMKADVEQQFKIKTTKLVQDLKEATPVDTGLARDSWEIKFEDNLTAIITNSQDYIQVLNSGSSKQAPRFFIERAILDNGFKVKGLATTKK
jgi:hypothetical protein